MNGESDVFNNEDMTRSELFQKIKSLLESIRELSPEEQKANTLEIETIRREKGEKALQDFLFKKFGLV